MYIAGKERWTKKDFCKIFCDVYERCLLCSRMHLFDQNTVKQNSNTVKYYYNLK